jgi:hypothetical protein
MEVLVFKTNISTQQNIAAIKPYLQSMPGILKWNIDLHDVDNVLRIETNALSPQMVEKNLKNLGFYCVELED